jgi:tetratricopeptide (TPR) repeat protein
MDVRIKGRTGMKKIGLALLVAVLLTTAYIYAQGYKGKGKVIGYVYDEAGNPLEGVKVKLFCQKGQSGFETVTDAKGKWKAFYIRGGPWNIDFEKAGYMPQKIAANINEYAKNPDVEIRMKKVEGLVISDELKEELRRGNELFDQEKYDEAILAYEAIIEKFPDVYIIYRNIGNSYFQMEEYEQAEENYLKVLEKDPDSYEAKLSIGNTYANRGQNDKALEWYNKIDFEKINNPLVLYNIGSNFYSQSELDEALKYYRKAVAIQNDFLDAIYQLGLVYLTLGNNEESFETFNEYLKYDPDSERADQVKRFIEFLKKK